ncbi:Mpo1-like protein [Tumebacillus algifaecis]|uniref:Mpo1-like protein n=1 Tax=Tumebacillus algifaecis TaxID=1214604 RepID=UPI001D130E65|nr:Mpo1-like protein [Tumebacillus algifaecis]
MHRIQQDLIRYQQAHQHPINQLLHYFAFLAALLGWIWLFLDWRVTLILAVLHYALSWTGHFCFEKNQPGSLKSPWLGFSAGFLWFFIRTLELLLRRKLLPV